MTTCPETSLLVHPNPCRPRARKMAPEVGLEPTTSRLIPTSRDSTIEQNLANPSCRLHSLDLTLPCHRRRSCGVFFAPDQIPWTVLAREFTIRLVRAIVGVQPGGQIIRLANVEFAAGVLKDVHPIHGFLKPNGSRGRARTYNITVNSRALYH
jgi:hypothetical protein